MTMLQQVERYVALKQHLGFRFRTQSRILRSYARHADGHGDEFVQSERMISWVAQSATPRAAKQKLPVLRSFAQWLRAEDDRHQIPLKHALGRPGKLRPTPCLLTCQQIEQVLAEALNLPPAGSITPHSFHFMIGLVACAGLRATEAVALRIPDITSDGMIIRETKFRKSRLVPLHDSVRAALERYFVMRQKIDGTSDRFFVLGSGKPTTASYLSVIFTRLARRIGLKEGSGRVGPTLHSLRHSFAVRSLEALDTTDQSEVSQHIMALSTYLGHVNAASTYWYLEATPSLLRSIADAAENSYIGGYKND